MFTSLLPIRYIVYAVLAATLMGGAFFGIARYNDYQQDIGAARVQLRWDAEKREQLEDAIQAQAAARAKERVLQAANQKVSQDYESLKQATATAVGALDDDRMRLQAALAAHRSPGDPTAGGKSDAATKDDILDGCVRAFAQVAGDAGRLSDQVTGLQKYVKDVVLNRTQKDK